MQQVRLGWVRLGQVRLGQVRLGQVRLGQVRLGYLRLAKKKKSQTLHYLMIPFRAGFQPYILICKSLPDTIVVAYLASWSAAKKSHKGLRPGFNITNIFTALIYNWAWWANKLERLSLASLSILVNFFRARLESTREKYRSGASLLARLQALPTYI